MNIGFAFLLILFSWAMLPFASDNVCRLHSKYDPTSDTTIVQCDLYHRDQAPLRLMVEASASFRGKEPNESSVFWFALGAELSNATRQTKPMFREVTTLVLQTDEETIDLSIKKYRHEYFELAHLSAESGRAEMSRSDLQKLQMTKSLKGKWGNMEINFSEAELAALKEFTSRHVLITSAN